MLIPPTGRLLAVDWGDVRIGLALSDESQVLASPLETLVRRAGKRFPMPRFLELVAAASARSGSWSGCRSRGEGDEGASAEAAREIADAIGRRTGLPARALGRADEHGPGARRHPGAGRLGPAAAGRTWTPSRRRCCCSTSSRRDGRREPER